MSDYLVWIGLRSLYFALAGIMGYFHYLKIGLALVLVFVGGKMILVDIYKIPIGLSLSGGGILLFSVLASLIWPRRPENIPVPHAS